MTAIDHAVIDQTDSKSDHIEALLLDLQTAQIDGDAEAAAQAHRMLGRLGIVARYRRLRIPAGSVQSEQ